VTHTHKPEEWYSMHIAISSRMPTMVGYCTMLQNDLIIYTIGSFNYQAKLGSIKKIMSSIQRFDPSVFQLQALQCKKHSLHPKYRMQNCRHSVIKIMVCPVCFI